MTTNTVQALKAHLALNVHNVERSIEFRGIVNFNQ